MNQRNRRRGLLVLAAAAVCVLPSARARAEGDKRQQAKEHYEKATRLYDVGKYGEAISEYENAYLLIEDAALLFNIGQAYRLWDRPEEAIRAYKNYLRRRPEAGNRADVEKKIADLERVLEERRRGATAPPPPVQPLRPPQPAQPVPSPAPIAEPPAAYVPAPPQPSAAPTAPQPGPPMYAPIAPSPSPTGDLASPPAGLAETTSAAAAPAPAEPAPRSRWLPITLLGVSGACLVGTAVAMSLGRTKAKALEEAADQGKPFDAAVQANGKTYNGLAIIGAAAALATGGLGVYLLLRGKGSGPAVSVAAVVLPGFSGGSARLTF